MASWSVFPLYRASARLNDGRVSWQASIVPRPPALPQPVPRKEDLISAGIPRERAELAARVGQLRWDHQWSWRDLGKAAQMNQKQVEDVERGRRDIQFSSLIKLANAFGLRSLDELLIVLPLSAWRVEDPGTTLRPHG